MHRFSAKHRPMCLDQARILLAPPLLPGMTMNLGPISPLLLPCTSRFKGRGVYLQLVSEPHFRKSFAIHESSRFQFICVHLYWTLSSWLQARVYTQCCQIYHQRIYICHIFAVYICTDIIGVFIFANPCLLVLAKLSWAPFPTPCSDAREEFYNSMCHY